MLLLLVCRCVLGQDQNRRLNFVFVIDNEVPDIAVISNGFFLAKDSSGNLKDSIPFKYEVGDLMMSSDDYRKLFLDTYTAKLFMNFAWLEYMKGDTEIHYYEREIPRGWINKLYMILYIYNYSNKESRTKYAIDKGGYNIRIMIPGMSMVVPVWKSYRKKHMNR